MKNYTRNHTIHNTKIFSTNHSPNFAFNIKELPNRDNTKIRRHKKYIHNKKKHAYFQKYHFFLIVLIGL